MSSRKLEQRVTALEQEVAEIKSQINHLSPSGPWWERIAGTFQDDAVYEKAMKLGRAYRRSLSADKSGRKEK